MKLSFINLIFCQSSLHPRRSTNLCIPLSILPSSPLFSPSLYFSFLAHVPWEEG
jgi:hypothetical protein